MQRTPTKHADLSQSFHQRLNSYALAASAAGVSLLALAPPAEAKIVYTPAHVRIGFGGLSIYQLDLNHDGFYDFAISAYVTHAVSDVILGAIGHASHFDNRIEVVRHEHSAAPLHAGQYIGPTRTFSFAGWMASDIYEGGSTFLKGPWINVRNRYLGLKFKYGGKTHYGWARLSVKVSPHLELTASLTGYAYETIPNKPIIAGKTDGPDDAGVEESSAALSVPTPKPANLGVLALGSPGLSIWRREESAVATR